MSSKKIIAFALAMLMILSAFCGCAKKEEKTDSSSSSSSSASSSKTETPASSTMGITHTEAAAVEVVEENVHPSEDARLKVAWNNDFIGVTGAGLPFGANLNASHLFAETLLKYNSATNEIEPFLATEWEQIDDLTLRLKLREDVTSIMGDPFTANDVIYTWKVGNETGANGSYFSALFDFEKCKAIDDYTVELVTYKPYPMLVQDLCHFAYSIVVEESVKKLGGIEACAADPSAQTGPYKLTKWDQGVCIYAERRDDYWGVTPYYKYVDQYIVTDNNTRAMGVEAGDYNLGCYLSLSVIAASQNNPDVTPWGIDAMGNFCTFIMNSDVEPLNIKEVRQAISLAIDREALLNVAISGLGSVTDSVYNTTMPIYTKPGEGNPNLENCMRYDLEAAKQKMIDAGFPDGFTISIKYKNTASVTPAVEIIQNMLKEINITVEPMMLEAAALSADLRAGNFEIQVSGGGNPNPKRVAMMYNPESTHNEATGSCGKNWAPDGTAELIDTCLTTIDFDERLGYFAELQDIIREYCPMITIYCPYTVLLTTPEITHVGLDVMSTVDLREIYPDEYLNAK